MCEIHRETPVPESFFIKVTDLYHATLLKENTPIQVFSDEFCKILKIPFYRTPPRNCFCSREKYFTCKIITL